MVHEDCEAMEYLSKPYWSCRKYHYFKHMPMCIAMITSNPTHLKKIIPL
jgi:hypothetical protein